MHSTITILELNIDALKFPIPEEPGKTGSNNCLSRILSPLKPKSKSSGPDCFVPKEYLPYDYEVFLVLRDFLQPASTISLQNAVDSVIEVFRIDILTGTYNLSTQSA